MFESLKTSVKILKCREKEKRAIRYLFAYKARKYNNKLSFEYCSD